MNDQAPTNQPPESTPLTMMHTRRFRVPGDIVNRSTSDLPDEQRSLIRWLHAHAAENDLSIDDLAKLVRYDASTLHRVFHGKYDGNLSRVCDEIKAFKALHEERNKGRRLGFIETALARKIWRVCDAALEFQRIAVIIGDSQTGKTAALERYREDHNHGSTIYVRCPTSGTLRLFLDEMARAMRISPNLVKHDLMERLLRSFDDRMLLIVDEIHQCCYGRADSALRTIEFIREIHDRTKCGVVLCGTSVFDEEMESGRFSRILAQTKRRRLCKLMLPNSPSAEDLNAFAAAYGLPPATGQHAKLQADIIRTEALGMWLCILRMAAKIAAKRKEKMNWDHVSAAHAGLRSLETI
ncbi:MAG: ATP-binding protein [Verrucomicrobiae bacterium]|nr:ATP-binding protein [Verrucomicrobiae bacterium]